MAGIAFDDGVYLLFPGLTQPTTDYSSGSNIYNKLILGDLTQTWTKTSLSGVSISCNGAGVLTISKTGLTSQTIDAGNRKYVYLLQNTDGVISVVAVYNTSGRWQSGGKWFYYWIGVDGVASGDYPTLVDFFNTVGTGNNRVYRYINLDSHETGGVMEWSNQAFANGYTYWEAFMGGQLYSTLGTQFQDLLTSDIVPDPPLITDPYEPGGISGGGGGSGTFDNTSVPIDFPPLPTLSATDAGFITLFNPSKSELIALADYMWNNPLFDLDTWKKIVADPMDAILGLAIVPVAVTPGTSKTLKIGNIATSVSMVEASRQYEEVDCGTLNVEECWGAYLDYDPYTKAELYLPYIGTHAISADDIMGKPVHIKYHVDILTGACCAYVKCGDSVLYTFSGQCSTSVPIASTDLTNVVNGVLGAAKAVGSMVATGGASAPSQIPGLVSTATNALKPNIEKSGSLAGTSGMLGAQIPYLILTRPQQALPYRQNKFIGYPSFVTANLGTLTGYTEVESIHLENVPATKAEIAEIETLLGNGVIF